MGYLRKTKVEQKLAIPSGTTSIAPQDQAMFNALQEKTYAKENCTILGGTWNVVTNSCVLPNKTFFQKFGKMILGGVGVVAVVIGLPKIIQAIKKGKK
ncbi:MAG: hypothetical protein PHX21_12870 [bacterium]|nr:hypothetical protein [bacterium]